MEPALPTEAATQPDLPLALLADTAAAWGLPLTPAQLGQFATYATELLRWNSRINLTSITDPEGIVVRHFLDALVCARYVPAVPQRIADVGTGAGVPGIPLKILWGTPHLTLIESVGKKTAFLAHLVGVLGLADVTILTSRAELPAHDPAHREQYDLVVARAVAALPALLEYCLPLARVGGRVLCPKGATIAAEVQSAQAALTTLGGTLNLVDPVHLPGIEARTMIVVDKRARTPARYPRAVGTPSRHPL
ncbi:MAG: 16S rRNA (guanine(527)-N(7))-methyltransferase RsmG [Chloroflexaceae bacterium]|nr:16S rRNA (guanine(527)-N(7))-methyltransferase RsmG [Chloroflexaceae bacterium]